MKLNLKVDWKIVLIGFIILLIMFVTLGMILKINYIIVGLIAGIIIPRIFKDKSNSELAVNEIIMFVFLILVVLILEFTGFKL